MSTLAAVSTIRCVQTALLSLVVYDYLLTLDCEVSCIWRREFNYVSVLFLVNRYSLLFLEAIEIVNLFAPSLCLGTSGLIAGLNLVLLLCITLFSTLRVYAVTRHRWLAIPTFLLGLTPIIVDVFFFSQEMLTSDGFSCSPIIPLALSLRLTLASRIILIVEDALVLLIIWLSTYGTRKAAQGLGGISQSANCLILTGTYFFFVALVLNITMLAVVFRTRTSFVSPVVVALPSILMSRFFLALRGTVYNSGIRSFDDIRSFDLTNFNAAEPDTPDNSKQTPSRSPQGRQTSEAFRLESLHLSIFEDFERQVEAELSQKSIDVYF